MKKQYNGENPAINDFIFEMVLITPIEKIVSKLDNREFRDCDIKYLNDKFCKFADFAGETLGVKVPVQLERESFPFMNDYVRNYYLEKFRTLLDYFKSF